MLAEVLQLNIENGYNRFIQTVAEGRNLESAAVENVAQGRVWAGMTAAEIGLVDRLGGLKKAIQGAAALAKLPDDYEVMIIQKPLSPRNRFLRTLMEQLSQFAAREGITTGRATTILDELGNGFDRREIEAILQIKDPQHLYALCPNCIVK